MSKALKEKFRAMLDAGLTQADALEVLGDRASVRPDWKDGACVRAKQLYADPSNDDIELDDKPMQSRSDYGTWVSAWVFVHDEELGGGT